MVRFYVDIDKLIIKEIRDCIEESRAENKDEDSEKQIFLKLQMRIDRLKVLLANFPNSVIESMAKSGRMDSNKSENSRKNHSRNSFCIVEEIYEFIKVLIRNKTQEEIFKKIL